MTDLAEFLRARLAEDEQVAREAAPGPWVYKDVDSVAGGMIYDPTVAIADLHYEQPGEVDPRIRRTVLSREADGTGAHIARHDPARVLAEVEAKRWIVDLHRTEVRTGLGPSPQYWCETCHVPGDYAGSSWCLTLRLLALPYAAHPDYQPEWKP